MDASIAEDTCFLGASERKRKRTQDTDECDVARDFLRPRSDVMHDKDATLVEADFQMSFHPNTPHHHDDEEDTLSWLQLHADHIVDASCIGSPFGESKKALLQLLQTEQVFCALSPSAPFLSAHMWRAHTLAV